MKKILSFIFLGAALLTMAACSDETETKVSYPPEITLSPSTVTLSSEAATCTIDYIVSNAVDGATIGLSADATWVSDFDTSASGQVAFSVSANTADELRTASLTLSYAYKDGTATAKAAIVQYGVKDPILSVDPEAVLASAEGGEYSFGYSIENPIEGETVECSTTATWVSGFTDADGTVSFTVAANDEGELRTATIIVSYYGLEKEVDVVQEHDSDDGITISVDPDAFVVDTEGGDFSFTYTVEGALDPTVTCATEEDWITNITDNVGTVSFTVAAMSSHELRTGFITVTCGKHTKEVEIVQDRLWDSKLRLDTDSITAEQAGGTYSFGYTLKNVGPGEIVTCSTEESWITDFDCSVEGTVTFSVTENTDYDQRTGIITVTYEEISKTVTVIQDPTNMDASPFVGTYSCAGKVYNEDYDGTNSMSVDSEWDMKIYANEDGTLTISGLVPDTEEYYPESGAYIATATIYGRNVCVDYPQWTGYYTTSGRSTYYICWIQCPEEGYYSSSSGTCTFEFTSGEGVAIGSKWTSDTGLFLALSSSRTSVSFYSYYDFFLPGMTFTKISDSTEDDDTEPDSITPTSLKSIDARPFHTGAKLAK